MTPMMRKDVETADLSSLVMEAANNTIPKGLEGTFTPFTNIYLAGQNALTLSANMLNHRNHLWFKGGRPDSLGGRRYGRARIAGAMTAAGCVTRAI